MNSKPRRPRDDKPHPRSPAAPALPTEGERLAKCVAALRNCSRSEAEQLIEGGWVRVDGRVVEDPPFRVTNQKIEIDADANPMELTTVTILMHKPPGFDAMAPLSTERSHVRSAQELLKALTHIPKDPVRTRVLQRHFTKLTPGIPLEDPASGLIVFTQDWRIARKLAEDAQWMEQELMVEVVGQVAPEILKRLNRGLENKGPPLPPVKVSVGSSSATTTTLRVAVKGSYPGLMGYLFDRVDLEIKSMKRIRIGRVAMTQLPLGQWRYLGEHERF